TPRRSARGPRWSGSGGRRAGEPRRRACPTVGVVTNLLELLGSSLPVVAAPMSGGPTTPALVLAAAEVGSAGSLAGGYQTAEALAAQVAEVRASTERYGVNLFSPNPEPV